jgi:hypothetical protein
MNILQRLAVIAIIFSITICSQTVNAQIPKLKKPKISLKKNNDKSNDSNELKEKVDGKPEYDPDDPTYRAYSRTRDNLKSVESIMNGSSWDLNRETENEQALKDLSKVKEGLEELKTLGEDKKNYYKEFQEDYARIESQRSSDMNKYNLEASYDKNLDSYYRWVAMGHEFKNEDLEPSYSGYYSFKEDFKKNHQEKYEGDYVQKRITAVDNFFEVEVYKELDNLERSIDKVIKNTHKLNNRGEEDYLLNAQSHLKKMEDLFSTVKYRKEYLLKDKTEINRIEAKLVKEKNMLDQYVSSGKCDAYRAKFKQELIDAVRIGSKGMSNSKYETMAKNGVTKGSPVRTVITSSIWDVKKNDFGYPQYKYLNVDIALKKDNKCYLAYGQIRKSYEGSGSYGSEFFNYWGIQEEMNCDNINK